MSIVNKEALKGLGAQLWWTGSNCSSNSPKSITSNGDCRQVLPYPGAGIGMFDGTGDYFSIPSNVMNFGTGDFTIEYLIKRNVMGGWERTFGNYASFANGSGSNFCIRFGMNSMNAVGYISGSGGSWSGDGGSVLYTHPDLINYHHIAFVRSGTTFKVYLNGVQTYSYTCGTQSLNTPSNPLIIGGWCTDGGEAANVNISEFRISSIARYTGEFTPPRYQLTNDSNTKLLLHFLNPLTDSSSNNLKITPSGSFTLSNTYPSPVTTNPVATVFGGASHISTPVNTGDIIGISGDNWTFETYALFTALPTEATCNNLLFMGDESNDSNRFAFAQYYGPIFSLGAGWGYQLNDSTSGAIRWQAIETPQLNTWYHIALVKTGLNVELYINGQIQTKTTGTTLSANIPARATYPLIIGKYRESYYYLQGMLSEVRLSNVARYSGSSFTPPTTRYVADANTKLLMHLDRIPSSIDDYSPSPKTITAYGDAKQLTSPCGSGVASFDGTGDYLSCITTDFQHAGDFTYEFWVLWNGSVPSDWPMIFDTRPTNASNSNAICVSINPSTYRINFYLNGTNYYWGDPPLPSNQWVHIAIVRSNGIVYIYQNGIVGSGTCNNSNTFTSATGVRIGGNIGDIGWWPGYISGFKVLDGIAKYTANFTPSTQPFKPDPYTKLLLHMDGVGAAFYDSSDRPGDNGFPILPDGVTVTPAGTFTSVKLKNGSNVLKFDGSTNYVSIADHAAWTVGAYNFTICLWAKFDAVDALRTLLHLFAATNSGIEVYLSASAKLCLKVSDTSTAGNMVNTTGSATIVAATWYHIAVVRNGSAFTVYLNLVSDSTGSSAATVINPTAIALGCRPSGTPDQFMIGNIKDAQIFNGRALNVDQIGALMEETYIY